MPEEITQAQEKTILALLSSTSISKAAQKAGVSAKQISRWLKDDAAFIAAYDELRNATFSQALAHIGAATIEASATLREVMEDKNAPHSARVTAARAVFEIHQRVLQQTELDALKKEVAELKNLLQK